MNKFILHVKHISMDSPDPTISHRVTVELDLSPEVRTMIQMRQCDFMHCVLLCDNKSKLWFRRLNIEKNQKLSFQSKPIGVQLCDSMRVELFADCPRGLGFALLVVTHRLQSGSYALAFFGAVMQTKIIGINVRPVKLLLPESNVYETSLEKMLNKYQLVASLAGGGGRIGDAASCFGERPFDRDQDGSVYMYCNMPYEQMIPFTVAFANEEGRFQDMVQGYADREMFVARAFFPNWHMYGNQDIRLKYYKNDAGADVRHLYIDGWFPSTQWLPQRTADRPATIASPTAQRPITPAYGISVVMRTDDEKPSLSTDYGENKMKDGSKDILTVDYGENKMKDGSKDENAEISKWTIIWICIVLIADYVSSIAAAIYRYRKYKISQSKEETTNGKTETHALSNTIQSDHYQASDNSGSDD